MNTTSLSTSNFGLQAFIAMALTASSLSTQEYDYTNSVTLPHYPAEGILNSSMIGGAISTDTTTTRTKSDANTSESNQYQLVKDLGNRLLSKSKDIEPEIAKIVNDNFWDLI